MVAKNRIAKKCKARADCGFPFWLPASGSAILRAMFDTVKTEIATAAGETHAPAEVSLTCPHAQKRLGELNSLMAADNFWNNREKAQTPD